MRVPWSYCSRCYSSEGPPFFLIVGLFAVMLLLGMLLAIGPATRCDEMRHFAAILKLLEPSQTIAAYRRYLLQNRSSVASQLPTMECFHILLRCASQQ